MKLLDKVKKRLEENYGIDFLSEFWTDDQIVLLEDIVDATEKEVNNINYTQCCKSDSEQLPIKEKLNFEDWLEFRKIDKLSDGAYRWEGSLYTESYVKSVYETYLR